MRRRILGQRDESHAGGVAGAVCRRDRPGDPQEMVSAGRVRRDIEDQGQVLALQMEEGCARLGGFLRQGRRQGAGRDGHRQAARLRSGREGTRRLEKGAGKTGRTAVSVANLAQEMVARREALLDRLIAVAKADGRIVAVWLQGSLARGDHDAYSDVDAYFAVDDAAFDAVWSERAALLGKI